MQTLTAPRWPPMKFELGGFERRKRQPAVSTAWLAVICLDCGTRATDLLQVLACFWDVVLCVLALIRTPRRYDLVFFSPFGTRLNNLVLIRVAVFYGDRWELRSTLVSGAHRRGHLRPRFLKSKIAHLRQGAKFDRFLRQRLFRFFFFFQKWCWCGSPAHVAPGLV